MDIYLFWLNIFTLFLTVVSTKPQALNFENDFEIHQDEPRNLPVNQQTIFGNNSSLRNLPVVKGLANKTIEEIYSTLENKTVTDTSKDSHNKNINNDVEEKQNESVSFDFRKTVEKREIDPKKHPYSVLLVMNTKSGKLLGRCTGSLITEEWVLTAAHCLHFPGGQLDAVIVYAGGNSLKDFGLVGDDKPLPTVQTSVSRHFIVHPNFRKAPQIYGSALLKLNTKFNKTDSVNTIQISSKPWQEQGYKQCVTTEFDNFYGQSSKNDASKTRTYEIQKPCLCSSEISKGFKVSDALFVCAKPIQDYGICPGDSGGGLVCNDNGTMEIRGISRQSLRFNDIMYCNIDPIQFMIVLPDSGCATKNTLTLFQDTFCHLSWINKHVNLFSDNEISECPETPSVSASLYTSLWSITVGLYLVNYWLCNRVV